MTDRHSVADENELVSDPDEIARLEVENGISQFNLTLEIVKNHIGDPDRPFRLRPSHILQLNHKALERIHRLAGTFRNSPVTISGSSHQPPDHFLIPEKVDELCD